MDKVGTLCTEASLHIMLDSARFGKKDLAGLKSVGKIDTLYYQMYRTVMHLV